MKKLALTCLFSAICALAFSQLLIENFDYAQGEFLTEHGWFTQYGATSPVSVSNGLTFEGYAESNIGNAALLDTEDRNQLHKSFAEVTSGNVYVAFMFSPIFAAKESWFFGLRDNIFDNINFNFNGRIFISEFNQISLAFADNQKKVAAELYLDENTTYLVVLKYAIKSGAKNDEVSLYVFDEFPEEEPQTPLIGPLSDSGKADISPANVVLRSYSSENWLVIDGIRVATTWDEAVKAAPKVGLSNTLGTKNYVSTTENGVLISLAEATQNVAIFDILGKKLTKEGLNLAAGDHNFSLKQGIYLVKIGNFSQKVIVK